MIVRTYGRRSRSNNITGSYSDDVVSDEFDDSLSQEPISHQEDIFSFAFSSQDSTTHNHWYNSFNSSQESRELTIKPSKSKKSKTSNKKRKFSKGATETTTLMETQEFGEMMEHVDEVNFALDGLRKGQPVRIRRASLLSLLTICGTLQQRRNLRTHGTAKTIIEAVLGLTFDDTPSNLAAAALFYILTSDGQEDHLLDSPSSIRFLLKLLKPLSSNATKDKVATIGSKLLALRKDAAIFQESKGVDSTSAAILLKVQEILVSCKEMKPSDGNSNGTEKPELSPKWIALLTLEKACLSSISLEETTGTVRKLGGNFKERLREQGGLDAVFEIIRNCHAIIEGWLEQNSSSTPESRNIVNLESVTVLLKCLKITENATMLSNDNQSHLLGIEDDFSYQRAPQSFTKLILSVIKILSGVSLLINSSGSSVKETCCNITDGTVHSSEMPSVADGKVDSNDIVIIGSSTDGCSMDWISSQKSSSVSHKSRKMSVDHSCVSEPISQTTVDTHLLKMRVKSSASGSCSGTSSTSNYGARSGTNGSWIKLGLGKKSGVSKDMKFEPMEDSEDPFAFDEGTNGSWIKLGLGKKSGVSKDMKFEPMEDSEDPFAFDEGTNGSWIKLGLGKKSGVSKGMKFEPMEDGEDPFAFDEGTNGSCIKLGLGKRSGVSEDAKFEPLEDSEDPFAFDEDECAPSKWDLLSGKQNPSQPQKSRVAVREEDKSQSVMVFSQQESCNMEHHNSPQVSCSPAVDEETSNLLADCLLTAVKVLMNLTNDNPVGCQQIAACGGLEILSSLIASHFPSFNTYLPTFSEVGDKSILEGDHQNNRRLTDQELDLLVAILGLLVNLVEKDGRNRLRLASASISLPSSEGSENDSTDVIPLLCSIFLANQGAGEAAEEVKQSAWDEEDPILQGEKEAEKMIVEAYSALLLAFLSTESKSIRNAIAECLPDHKLAILVPVLERFLEFHLALNMISSETHTTVLEVIESCRVP